ncbi:39S mitochondrial ribosomal protein L46 [Nitzschia inconspicua]|uniref:39S mitochondrial ribosomal protein L46 n=1 Tax=Nitzschia inconspicua TaxID=303405 RepID=A0A9K3PBS1_9STRA|nr:39S mitochondrial ribosomal protein L46 [Nitzschia inconspicua]
MITSATSVARPIRMAFTTAVNHVTTTTIKSHNNNRIISHLWIPVESSSPLLSSGMVRSYSSTTSTMKKSKKSDDEAENAAKLSYFDRKAAQKEQRKQQYQHKLVRSVQLIHRRDGAPKDVLKNEFRSWWDGRRIQEEKLERKARQAGLEWKIQVATIVERLPVVLPDKTDFEQEFEVLQASLLSQRGKKYPVEFTGTSGNERPVAITDEELWALLPENYRPAPRETQADLDGTVNTTDRKLKDRVYLMVDNSFPTTELRGTDNDSDESLLEAALRGLGEKISPANKGSGAGGGGEGGRNVQRNASGLPLDLYCPSNAPVAVQLVPYDAEQQKSTGYFGTKTFYVKVQYDDGKINTKTVDFAWLDRAEIVDRIEASLGKDQAKFYQRLYDLAKLLPQITSHHIKGHKDRQVALDKLSRPAKLNIQADKLAGNYQRRSSRKNIPTPKMEGTHCHLIYDGQTVAFKHRKLIRDHRRANELKTYILQNSQMSEDAFLQGSIGRAMDAPLTRSKTALTYS